MQHVSSLGGPRVLLPTSDIACWINELGNSPTPDNALYRLACSVDDYCGIIKPWDTPLLIFGDDPSDIYYCPDQFSGLFFRWVGADSLEQLTAFAITESQGELWDEAIEFNVVDGDMTLMDTCTLYDDTEPRIHMNMQTGSYTISSRFAESPNVMTIIHRLEYVG